MPSSASVAVAEKVIGVPAVVTLPAAGLVRETTGLALMVTATCFESLRPSVSVTAA